jgi:argininosuccinate lyase
LQVAGIVMRNISVVRERALAAAATGYMNATELADYLVRKGMPFRQAHEVVGKIVMRAVEKGIEIQGLALVELKRFSDLIDADVFEALSLEQTVRSKSQLGGTARARVSDELQSARETLKSE